jgi:4-nitrophenyl phosphatase
MDVRGAILDVDGTLVRGADTIPGATDAVATLRSAGVDIVCCSNNPTAASKAYAERLERAGFSFGPDEVVTSGVVTAEFLAREYPDEPTFVVGEAGLVDVLGDHGVSVTNDPDAAEVVVGSIDREFTYDRLATARRALEGAVFVGTDPDPVIPGSDSLLPGSGAIIDALASVAGRRPDRMMGKPARPARRMALARLDIPPGDCLVVGDRLDTDVAMGNRAGATTALVTTGVTDREAVRDADADCRPDHVLDSIADVDRLTG